MRHQKSIKKDSLANLRKEPLTPEMLRSFKGLGNLSDAEAEEIIHSLDALARLLLEMTSRTLGKDNLFQ